MEPIYENKPKKIRVEKTEEQKSEDMQTMVAAIVIVCLFFMPFTFFLGWRMSLLEKELNHKPASIEKIIK